MSESDSEPSDTEDAYVPPPAQYWEPHQDPKRFGVHFQPKFVLRGKEDTCAKELLDIIENAATADDATLQEYKEYLQKAPDKFDETGLYILHMVALMYVWPAHERGVLFKIDEWNETEPQVDKDRLHWFQLACNEYRGGMYDAQEWLVSRGLSFLRTVDKDNDKSPIYYRIVPIDMDIPEDDDEKVAEIVRIVGSIFDLDALAAGEKTPYMCNYSGADLVSGIYEDEAKPGMMKVPRVAKMLRCPGIQEKVNEAMAKWNRTLSVNRLVLPNGFDDDIHTGDRLVARAIPPPVHLSSSSFDPHVDYAAQIQALSQEVRGDFHDESEENKTLNYVYECLKKRRDRLRRGEKIHITWTGAPMVNKVTARLDELDTLMIESESISHTEKEGNDHTQAKLTFKRTRDEAFDNSTEAAETTQSTQDDQHKKQKTLK